MAQVRQHQRGDVMVLIAHRKHALFLHRERVEMLIADLRQRAPDGDNLPDTVQQRAVARFLLFHIYRLIAKGAVGN